MSVAPVGAELVDDLDAARARWAERGPVEYSFRSLIECACSADEPLQAVEVRDGEIVSEIGPLRSISTVEEWFGLIESSIDSDADISVMFDPELGHPVSVRYEDPVTDESEIVMQQGTVTELVPLRFESGDVPDPAEMDWLAPSEGIDGLDLVEADRFLGADCGPTSTCAPYLPSAILHYEAASGDLSVRIDQRYPTPFLALPAVAGEISRLDVGLRRFVIGINERDGGIMSINVLSIAPDGVVLFIDAVGTETLNVEAVIQSLRPTNPTDWPVVDRAPLGETELAQLQQRCVDDDSRFAPTHIPAGWSRFVLSAQPTGSCDDGPFMWLSFSQPSADETSTSSLINLFVLPAHGTDLGLGTPIEIAGNPARVFDNTQEPDGAQTKITMQIGDVLIRAEGAADRDTLEAILASTQLLDNSEWEAYVASTAQPPPN